MVVKFERSGGFAGLRLCVDVNADDLPPAERQQLEGWLRGADFFALPAHFSAPGADQYVYRVCVQMPGREHAVEAPETALPPGLKPLVSWLSQRAAPARPA